ncbi:MAG TPA: thioredoxin-disulfide reductase [Anaerolineae bacterium]|nr:thioredoxin-disulfide reductase [Anaerolineae bacterium]
MNEVTHDIIIIGGGPAGLTAGIYAGREMLDTLLLEKGLCGGVPMSTDVIENYPGFPGGVKGMDLMDRFRKQAEEFGVKIREFEEVKKIEPLGKRIKVQTDRNEYSAYAVIVASGSLPKKLGIPGEDEFLGKGVSYCATCDGPLYRDKDVAVIGCGNSGLQEGESLLQYVKSVTFVEFLPYMTAEKILQERVRRSEKARFLLHHVLTSINGDTLVHSITVKNRESGEEKEIQVSGVFIYVGLLPNSTFLEGVVELDDGGYVISDEEMATSVPGIYAVGDVRSKKVRQISVACGEATIAAISAREYLKGLRSG